MKKLLPTLMLVCTLISFGCGSSSNSSGSNSTADTYAIFGKTLSDAVPTGLKTGGANADIAASVAKALSGQCLDSYADCPYLTTAGGGDSMTGEILMRLWGLDYHDECTSSLISAGTCFFCADCQAGEVGVHYIKPTLLENPTACAATSTSTGRYVNFGVDPCFFDAMIGQISNIAECETVQGGAIDISSAIPWYASWGLSQTVNFSSYYARDGGGGIWWTVNSGASGNQQHFLSLDSNWLYMGVKDPGSDAFLFLGTGSPAYYNGLNEGNGVNIAAYAGTLSAIPAQFEAIQVRVQSPNDYIERMTSNGSYLWYQSWQGSDFPSTPDQVDTIKNTPTNTRCVQIGASIVSSKYAPLADCVTSFGKASAEALNQDSNYTLKIIDGQTANSIDFSSSLTPATTTTSCLAQ